MEKIYQKIENYVIENFPKREVIKDANLVSSEQEGVEVYGFNTVLVLVKEVDGKVFYNHIFSIKN